MPDDTARLVAVLEADISRFSKGMADAQRIADERFGAIEKGMRRTESTFGSAFSNLTSLAAKFGIALSVASITAYVKGITQSTAALEGQAATLGISTSALQAYRASAILAGAGAEVGEAAIQRFTRSIGDAAEAQGPARKAFQDLGLTAADLAGGTEAALPKVAAAILKIKDVSERARIEVALFGKSGQQSEQLLRGWADPQLISHMDHMGLVIDQQLIKKAAEADREWNLFFTHLKVWSASALFGSWAPPRTPQEQKEFMTRDTAHPFTFPFAGADSLGIMKQGAEASAAAATPAWKGLNKAFDDFLAKQVLASKLAAETTQQRMIDQRIIEAAAAKLKDQGKDTEITVKSLEQARQIIGASAVAQLTQITNQETLNKLLGEGLDRIEQIKAAAGSVTWDQKFLDGLEQTTKAKVLVDALKGIPEAATEQFKPDVRAYRTNQLLSDLQEQADIAAILPQYREAELLILGEQHNKNIELSADQEDQIRNLIDIRQHNEQIVDVIDQMQSDFENFLMDVETKGKFSFGSLFRSILNDWLGLQNKMIAQWLFNGTGAGGLGGPLGSAASFVGSLFGIGSTASVPFEGHGFAGKFASGGTLQPGQWGIAGERGPERIFAGSSSLTVMPNIPRVNAGSPSGSTIYIDARGAQEGVSDQIASAIRAAAPQIVGASVRQVNTQFPGMLTEHQKRRF